MSSISLAKKKMREISDILLGDDFQHFWGHLIPDVKAKTSLWTKAEMRFIRKGKYPEATITALGAGSAQTGDHYDYQILDDLVDGKSEGSENQMSQAIDFLERTEGLRIRGRDCHLLVVGTAWAGGYYEELLDDDGFQKAVFGCYVDDRFRDFMSSLGYDSSAMKNGDPVFNRETLESLDRARRRFKGKFPNQMENLFQSKSLRRFVRDDFKFFKWSDDQKSVVVDNVYYPLSTMYIQLTIDPGGGGDNADESAIVVSAWNRGNAIAFILDVWHDSVTTKPLIEQIFKMAKQWDVHAVRPEYAAMQETIGHWLKDQMVIRDEFYALDPARHKHRGKGERIDALQPYIASHQVFFRKDQPDVINEAINVIITDGKIKGKNSPNMVDALAYHVDRWNSAPVRVVNDGEIPYVEDQELDKEYYVRYGLTCPTRSPRRMRV